MINFVIWAANHLTKSASKEQVKNILDNLKNNRGVVEKAVSCDLQQLSSVYVMETCSSVLIEDFTKCAKEIVAYMCDVKFKNELAAL